MRDADRRVMEAILARLRPALDRWYEGDPSGYAELFAGRLTYFDPRTEGRLADRDALRSHYAPIEGLVKVPRFEVVDPGLQRRGDMAVLTYNLHEHADDGPPSARWNATEVYHRTRDGWRAIHAHWSSIPFDPTTPSTATA